MDLSCKCRNVKRIPGIHFNVWKSLSVATIVILFVFVTFVLREKHVKKVSDNICFNMNEVLKGPIAQDDPRLLQYVRKHHLFSPASRSTNYNIRTPPHGDPSKGQSKIVLNLLKNKTGGFFVECGAHNGENYSNTLYMERELGWKGLLIEANPYHVEAMKQKNRKAWIADTCLSRFPYPENVRFVNDGYAGRITERKKHKANITKVQCIPLYTLLSALNKSYVDYLSLDVEGNEINVLRSFPFDKITIKVISVEYGISPQNVLRNVLKEKGYIIIDTMRIPSATDFIAMRKM